MLLQPVALIALAASPLFICNRQMGRLAVQRLCVSHQVAKDAVVVEADAIKNRDVVYRQLSQSLPSSANIAAEVCCVWNPGVN